MEPLLFLEKLARLPVSSISNIDCQHCRGLRLIVVGEPPVSHQAAQALAAQGAEIIRVIVADTFVGWTVSPDIVQLLTAEDLYDSLVLVGPAELLLLEIFKAYRSRLRLFRPERHTREQLNIALLSDEVSRRVMSQQLHLLQNNCYLDGFSAEAGGQYTHPRVHAVAGEQILCIGPYLGKPLQAFAITSGGQFQAHCLEANSFTYAELCINLVSWGMHTSGASGMRWCVVHYRYGCFCQ